MIGTETEVIVTSADSVESVINLIGTPIEFMAMKTDFVGSETEIIPTPIDFIETVQKIQGTLVGF